LTVLEQAFYDGNEGSMKREFVINRLGKDYVLYAGLLDEAHQQGLTAIKTQLVQVPTSQNGQVAICLAEVTTEKGTFTGLGDASPDNVSRAMVNALIRLAETRAKARALRDAINVSMVAVEELGDSSSDSMAGDGVIEAQPPRLVAMPPTMLHAVPSSSQASSSQASSPASLPTSAPPVPAVATVAAPGQSNHVVPGSPVSMPVGHTLPAGVVPLETARPRRIREASAGANGANGSHSSNGNGNNGNGTGSAKTADAAPATPTQIETISKLARSVGRIVPTGDLTRAAASELITRLSEERYGARRS
jgi:hypothetical protein